MNPSSIFLRNDSTLVNEKSMEATCYWKQVQYLSKIYNLTLLAFILVLKSIGTEICTQTAFRGSNLFSFYLRLDRLIKLIDSSSGTFQDFIGHTDYVRNLKFSNDGKLLLSTALNELFSWKLLL